MNFTSQKKEFLLIFFLALTIVTGGGYNTYLDFDFSHSPDTISYMQMGQGDFDVEVTHRYRFIVPALAAGLAWPVDVIYEFVWPHRPGSEWPLRFGFFLINSIFMALFGLVLYLLARNYGASMLASVIAMAAVLTSRWAMYSAGLPLVDSLYLLMVALLFYGLKTKSMRILIFCFFVGPLAKESFILFLPIVFFFGGDIISRKHQAGLYLLAGVFIFVIRYLIDMQINAAPIESIDNAIGHTENIGITLRRILSVKGAGEVFQIFGFISLILLAGFFGGKQSRTSWMQHIDKPLLWMIAVVVIHIFLSTNVGRMGYLAAPVFAVALAMILDNHPLFKFLKMEWDKSANPIRN